MADTRNSRYRSTSGSRRTTSPSRGSSPRTSSSRTSSPRTSSSRNSSARSTSSRNSSARRPAGNRAPSQSGAYRRPVQRRRGGRWRVDKPGRLLLILVILLVLMILLISKIANRHKGAAQEETSIAQEASVEEGNATGELEGTSEGASESTQESVEPVESESADANVDENGVHIVPSENSAATNGSSTVRLSSGYTTSLSHLDEQLMGFMSGIVLSNLENHAKQPEEQQTTQRVRYDYHIVIDPAHGGEDTGIVIDDVTESQLNLLIAQKVQARIRVLDSSIEAILTREDNTYAELNDRAQLANDRNADFFINLQCASNEEDSEMTGLSVLYWQAEDDETDIGERSRQAAEAIAEKAASAIRRPNLGAQAEVLEVLYKTNMPAVSVRMGFLTNDYDRATLLDEALQDALAEAIAEQIVSIVNSYAPQVDVNIPEVTVPESSESEESSTDELSDEDFSGDVSIDEDLMPESSENGQE